ncbi:hypothetical protein ACLOJK_027858 [Asimina triloba]
MYQCAEGSNLVIVAHFAPWFELLADVFSLLIGGGPMFVVLNKKQHLLLRAIPMSGIINGTAPNPVRLSEMCNHLGEVMGRPSWLPVPDFAVKALLGEGATIVLDGQKVLPTKAKELGFSYRYPFVKDALKASLVDLTFWGSRRQSYDKPRYYRDKKRKVLKVKILLNRNYGGSALIRAFAHHEISK